MQCCAVRTRGVRRKFTFDTGYVNSSRTTYTTIPLSSVNGNIRPMVEASVTWAKLFKTHPFEKPTQKQTFF